jgi:hypothetical protein
MRVFYHCVHYLELALGRGSRRWGSAGNREVVGGHRGDRESLDAKDRHGRRRRGWDSAAIDSFKGAVEAARQGDLTGVRQFAGWFEDEE